MREKWQIKKPDFLLFVVTVLLVGFGVFMVYNASYMVAGRDYGRPAYFAIRQAVFALAGLGVMFAVMYMPYWKLRAHSGWILGFALVACMAVLKVGHESRGATRWVQVGPVTVQPSEFAKLCLVFFLASVLTARKMRIYDVGKMVVPVLLPLVALFALVAKEDLGTAIVLCMCAFAMFYMAGAARSHLMAGSTLLALGGAVMVMIEKYRLDRIRAWLDPFKYYHGEGYQICQSLIALGSGGVMGVGLCESRQKLGYLPASYTDFIYSISGQEFGLIGALLIAGLYLAFAVLGLRIALRAKDPFSRLVASGISVLIGGQALLNLAVVTSSVPATGVPLPFVSYGGSSLILNLVCAGILLGVSRNQNMTGSEHEDSPDRRRNRRARVSRPQYSR